MKTDLQVFEGLMSMFLFAQSAHNNSPIIHNKYIKLIFIFAHKATYVHKNCLNNITPLLHSYIRYYHGLGGLRGAIVWLQSLSNSGGYVKLLWQIETRNECQ